VTAQPETEEIRTKYGSPMFALLTSCWGEHLHMGLFESPDDQLALATERACAMMADDAAIGPGSVVCEVACGIGGSSRFLARRGARVMASNISPEQVGTASVMNREAGFDEDRIETRVADYHDLPYGDGWADAYWNVEALLYTDDKKRVLREGARVLKPGGRLVVSDLTMAEDTPPAERADLGARVGAHHYWSVERYDALVADLGYTVEKRAVLSPHVEPTFARVTANMLANREAFAAQVGADPVEAACIRLEMQRRFAEMGWLGWYYTVLRPS